MPSATDDGSLKRVGMDKERVEKALQVVRSSLKSQLPVTQRRYSGEADKTLSRVNK